MNHRKSSMQTIWTVAALTFVMGLSGLAFAKPPEATPPFIEAILDRLDEIETKIDNLETKIDTQSTDLRGVTQNWDKKLDATNGDTTAGREGCDSDRFTCLFGDTAVRDNETGLVWDRSPDIDFNDGKLVWSTANSFCADPTVEGGAGFHLPLHEQLSSLVDTGSDLCIAGGPCLPDGHPFLNIQSAKYWSATTSAGSPVLARNVNFEDGGLGSASNKTSSEFNWWCVRGGQSFDGNTHDTLH
jgi:hypothetical protein